jgi:hypothetical protein
MVVDSSRDSSDGPLARWQQGYSLHSSSLAIRQ